MAASAFLIDNFESGLSAPICLTWELTYACNLQCVHCLSSSGRRDARELSTQDWVSFLDDLKEMQVFYVNIGGGEPTLRSDFWDLVTYAVGNGVGVKFSTNGFKVSRERASWLAQTEYVDVQISLDGATAVVNDRIRGTGSFSAALAALEHLASAGFRDPKISVVMTRENISQLDEFKMLADRYGATLRLTRLRPSGRAVDVWDSLHPTAQQQRDLHAWLVSQGASVMTGDSFFHLSALGTAIDGLNTCGAGRVVCLVDPIGDVYACPFAIHEQFLAGNLRDSSFHSIWHSAPTFERLREPSDPGACRSCNSYDLCRGGCMAAKFFTGLPLNGPDPECVHGHGGGASGPRPKAFGDHTRQRKVFLPLPNVPSRPCQQSPVS